MEKKDEQADYHFSLAAAEHPSRQVMRNIANFRDAIRARRSWRFNFDFGFAPDSNINSATDKKSVDIYGLPFQLDPDARARSGTGRFVGGDASVRLNRFGQNPDLRGRLWPIGSLRRSSFRRCLCRRRGGAGVPLAGGHLRTIATGLMRWYGKRPARTSVRCAGRIREAGGRHGIRRNAAGSTQ